MSEFLLVTPEGWLEVPNAQELITAAGGEVGVLDMLSQSPNTIDSVIEPLGLPPAGMTTGAANLFKDGGIYRLWVQFVPA